ncbi:MAG: hypothetical protein VX252_15745 [Myxococcota bacterium]|nr:hypothetical protein [Myxococcota bacterium]
MDESRERSRRFENALLIIAILVVGLLGIERYLEDSSLWIDEAFIALTVKSASPWDLFGPVGMGHSFPRFYLLSIQGLTHLFGYETWVLRVLPLTFFLLATWLWFKLLFNRIFAFPVLMVLALFLNLLPVSWFEYSSAFKQYSFDVFLALLPFFVSDAALKACFRDGQHRWLALALTLPCALSYTYGISVLGRLVGWYGFALRDRLPRLDLASTALAAAGLLLGSLSLYFTDIRFMAGSVYGFWEGATLASEGSSFSGLLMQLIIGPYSGQQEVGHPTGVPRAFLYFLVLVFLLGVARILMGSLRPNFAETGREWGSRSLGALAMLVGLLMASWLIRYPVATGRLTLFLLPFMQIILFEGFCFIHSRVGRLPRGAWISVALGILWIGCVAPSAIQTSARFIERENRDNIRSLEDQFRAAQELPIFTMPLLAPTVLATPHDFEASRFVTGPPIHEIPWGREIFIVDTHQGQARYTQGNPFPKLKDAAASFVKIQGTHDSLYLYRATFPENPSQTR